MENKKVNKRNNDSKKNLLEEKVISISKVTKVLLTSHSHLTYLLSKE